jgi:glycosyltransferase involved in cell wall biosynthesis
VAVNPSEGAQATPRASSERVLRLVSVVVAVRNEEAHLPAQLEALAGQTYRQPWELIVVDNGSTDGSRGVVERWAPQLPPLTVVDASGRRGLSYAKNLGIVWAQGDLLAFCDADDVVSPGWLLALVEAALDGDVVAGRFDYRTLNDARRRAWRPEQERDGLPVGLGFLPYAPGGNCAVWAAVALELGWNEAFAFGGDDQDFSWRAQLAGYRLVYARDALVQLRFRTGLGELARQWFAYGRAGSVLFDSFHAAGMPRTRPKEALRTWRWLLRRSPDLVRSSQRRGNWVRLASLRAGRVAGSLRVRKLFL